jgi:hypothetical protein
MTRCHGQFFAPAKIAFPPSMAVMARSGVFQARKGHYLYCQCRERLAGYGQDVRSGFLLSAIAPCIALTSTFMYWRAKFAFLPSMAVMARSGAFRASNVYSSERWFRYNYTCVALYKPHSCHAHPKHPCYPNALRTKLISPHFFTKPPSLSLLPAVILMKI